MDVLQFLLIVTIVNLSSQDEELVKSRCDFFCDGEILDAVQRSAIFPDSKHFVDMPLKTSKEQLFRDFQELKQTNREKMSKRALRQLVEKHFSDPGSELESCVPEDWVQNPEWLKAVPTELRSWANDLNEKWNHLCRKVKSSAANVNSFSTFLPVPHPFIVPGGRFRELYYWDTYWVIRGLLATGMDTTAKGMIQNLGSFVTKFGFVPNGARAYYLRRSQPPLLTQMVFQYYKKTHDKRFLREMLPVLDKEHDYWMENHAYRFGKHTVFRYKVDQFVPRPESYREDFATASSFPDDEKSRVYADLASAAESGHDFSSRWFADETPNNLSSIQTMNVIPVDLNAFIALNTKQLMWMHFTLGHRKQGVKYHRLYIKLYIALKDLFWNPKAGIWQDINIISGQHKSGFYVSNIAPLFTGHASTKQTILVVQYLKDAIQKYPMCVPTSHVHSGQQWDAPNGWPPMNHMVIMGLINSNVSTAVELGRNLMQTWIATNFAAYNMSEGKMFEKFNCEDKDDPAGRGGEYNVQEGFGWTNGVVLEFLLKYSGVIRQD